MRCTDGREDSKRDILLPLPASAGTISAMVFSVPFTKKGDQGKLTVGVIPVLLSVFEAVIPIER